MHTKIFLTGATGYLGNLLIPFLLDKYHPQELHLFARNEHKLAVLKKKYPQTTVCIGDIRDRERVKTKIEGCNLVIHAAALKRVDSGSIDPQEMIKTNIIGSMNVMDACIQLKIPHAIFVSSDKAVNPLNLYGKTKSVVESMVLERAKTLKHTIITVIRYGNVLGSTGSVIPFFISQAKQNQPLTITNHEMTRFLITKKEVLDIISRAIIEKKQSQVILPKQLISTTIIGLAQLIKGHLCSSSEIVNIPMQSGEKIHEEIEQGISSDKYLICRDELLNILKEEELL